MSRRASLPGAAELFRLTSSPSLEPAVEVPRPAGNGHKEELDRGGAARRGTGRTKHDTKITVYLSADELVAMEQARLTLRAKHSMVVDRGRMVREAVAVLLAEFEEHGEDSVLVRRLRADDLEAEEATRS